MAKQCEVCCSVGGLFRGMDFLRAELWFQPFLFARQVRHFGCRKMVLYACLSVPKLGTSGFAIEQAG